MEIKKMTQQEVEKGLECCAEFLCGECPYRYLDDKEYSMRCVHNLIVDVAALYKKISNRKIRW